VRWRLYNAKKVLEESKMEQLRKLDESAARPGTIAALVLGIVSALLLGQECAAPWSGQTGILCRVLWWV
jgi:hypothetical protein